mmetsp:Transcript_5707/g.25371  ORF Transcript_5707/g.25371 Transcript_5707/m.25371 type:complete len:219 (+) Transcript_5707:766-1422(+)
MASISVFAASISVSAASISTFSSAFFSSSPRSLIGPSSPSSSSSSSANCPSTTPSPSPDPGSPPPTTAAVRSSSLATRRTPPENFSSTSTNALSAKPTLRTVPTEEPPTPLCGASITLDAVAATCSRRSCASINRPVAMRHAPRSMLMDRSSSLTWSRSWCSALEREISASAHAPDCICACPRSLYSVDNRLWTLTVFLHPAVRIIHPVLPSANAFWL